MKLRIKNLTGVALIASIFMATGCSKDFFNRPPESSITAGSYYQTTAQVQASTNALYAMPWFGFNGKVFLTIGDLQSGNAINGGGSDPTMDPFFNFSQNNGSDAVRSAWFALYTVVAQSNALLSNLPATVPASVPTNVVNNALGEARLIRATAYFYLAKNFRDVPIITDPTVLVGSFQTVPVNPVTDVYKFIVNDLRFAEANCTPNVASSGHASSGTASGMLAKVYLYLQNYDSARIEAEKVINSGEFSLVGTGGSALSFVNLFESAGNNSSESMLQEQWGAGANSGYGHGNQIQSVVAPSNGNGGNPTNLTGFTDGWAELGVSFDLQNLFKANGDVTRRYGTYMLAGDFYPEITKADGGLTVPTTISAQNSHAAIKKYVTGTPADNGGIGAMQSSAANTTLLRFADMYLIAAEAIVGKAAGVQQGKGIPLTTSSSDATALGYINVIRKRAGVAPLSGSFTYQQLLDERRMEFAFEGDFWYDLQRIDGFNSSTHPVAIGIIKAQNRGGATAGTEANNYLDYTINTFNVSPTDTNFLLPIPATEAAADPALLQPPVPYDFSNN
ncbi:MAG: RagB/SusD family nutrient uptake outer membrane protein [Chitinophagaceae bacterium]|jgi:hypothetical protein|nr:RagB/SusD family nutrient uptake outer membrane protein [Chitinophagaceae bacterium]